MRVKSIVFIAVALISALALAGCIAASNAPPEVEHTIESPLFTEDITEAVLTEVNAASVRFEAEIHKLLPILTLEITKTDESDRDEADYFYTYIISVTCPEQPDFITQEFRVKSCLEDIRDEREFLLVDIDFDGYKDIEVLTDRGSTNMEFDYYRWDSASGSFEEAPFFNMFYVDYQSFTELKQIIAKTNDSAASYGRYMYQIIDGDYNLLRYESTEIVGDMDNGYLWTVHIYDEFGEIYSETITGDEYHEISEIRDNYLRFGTANVISVEEAQQLLYEKHGSEATGGMIDSDTVYPLSYMFDEITVIDGVSCYTFRMSWLVDDCHWSFVDYLHVAPDGTIISSSGNVLN